MDSIIFDKELESFSISKTCNFIKTRRFSSKGLIIYFIKLRRKLDYFWVKFLFCEILPRYDFRVFIPD